MYSPLYVLAGSFLLFMFHYVFAIENVVCSVYCTARQWRNMPFAAFFK